MRSHEHAPVFKYKFTGPTGSSRAIQVEELRVQRGPQTLPWHCQKHRRMGLHLCLPSDHKLVVPPTLCSTFPTLSTARSSPNRSGFGQQTCEGPIPSLQFFLIFFLLTLKLCHVWQSIFYSCIFLNTGLQVKEV